MKAQFRLTTSNEYQPQEWQYGESEEFCEWQKRGRVHMAHVPSGSRFPSAGTPIFHRRDPNARHVVTLSRTPARGGFICCGFLHNMFTYLFLPHPFMRFILATRWETLALYFYGFIYDLINFVVQVNYLLDLPFIWRTSLK